MYEANKRAIFLRTYEIYILNEVSSRDDDVSEMFRTFIVHLVCGMTKSSLFCTFYPLFSLMIERVDCHLIHVHVMTRYTTMSRTTLRTTSQRSWNGVPTRVNKEHLHIYELLPFISKTPLTPGPEYTHCCLNGETRSANSYLLPPTILSRYASVVWKICESFPTYHTFISSVLTDLY